MKSLIICFYEAQVAMPSGDRKPARRKVLQLGGAALAGLAGMSGIGAADSPSGDGQNPSARIDGEDHKIHESELGDEVAANIVGRINSSEQFKAVKRKLKTYGIILKASAVGGTVKTNETVGDVARQVKVETKARGNSDAEATAHVVEVASEDDLKVVAEVETKDTIVSIMSDSTIVQMADDGVQAIPAAKDEGGEI